MRKRYAPEEILQEAELYLNGMTMPVISMKLRVPISTISYHFINQLKRLDYESWIYIRNRLVTKAKNLTRVREETEEIYLYQKKKGAN